MNGASHSSRPSGRPGRMSQPLALRRKIETCRQKGTERKVRALYQGRLPGSATLGMSCEEVASNSPYRRDGVRNDDEDAPGRSIRTQRKGTVGFWERDKHQGLVCQPVIFTRSREMVWMAGDRSNVLRVPPSRSRVLAAARLALGPGGLGPVRARYWTST